MKFSANYTALLCLFVSSAYATEELTPQTFKEYTSSGQNGMVKFYQSWCGHCMRMAADWNKLAEEAPSDVFIKDVNCGEQNDLCNDNDVQGYPTIKYWINGQEHDYDGSREYDDMHSFVLAELSLPCNFKERENCSEKALKYVQKWEVKSEEERQKELDRLTKIVKEGNNMKADLKKWAMERKRILKNSLFSDEL